MFVIPALEPIAFTLFGFPVYWYGIIMAFAILIAMLVSNTLYNKCYPNLKKDVIIEYAPVIIIFGIICARLYFCLLNHNYYFSNPLEILDLRQGGLSIHGAIFGGILSLIVIAKLKNLPVFCFLDPLACGTILGQAVGRWGNYFNSEAYGIPVAGQSWGLFIPESKRAFEYLEYNLFHPTFLYESCLNFVGFLLLLYLILNFGNKFKGITFYVYLCVYALIRFFVERIRVDSVYDVAGVVPIAEAVSLCLLIVGLVGLIYTLLKNLQYK